MSRQLPRTVVTAVALAVSLSGCGRQPVPGGFAAPSGSSGAGEGGEPRGRSFASVSATERGEPRALVAGTTVVLRFADDGRLNATAGCNTMSGAVTLTGGKVAVAELAITDKGCEPALHRQDEWLTDLLLAKPSWRLDGANLVLASPDAEIVLAPEVAAPLAGPQWTVDGLVTGSTASSVPGGVTATLVFRDGTVTVSTGCNTGSARYRENGAMLALEPLVLTKKACGPDETAVERAVVAVLDGAVSHRIDLVTLTLLNARGDGLNLRST
jgi:heat shock protein HslJ